jgi:uncharacterized phage-associated protein
LTTHPFQADDEKLRELMLYICRKSINDETFSSVKLNKLLYHSDFTAFRLLGEPITGQEYHAIQFGPAPRRMVPIIREMEASNALITVEQMYFTKSQRRHVPCVPPVLDKFSGAEIALVDAVIEEHRHENASEISDNSHGIAWNIVGFKGLIPYEFAYISDDPVSPYVIERTRELAAERGW